MHWVNEPVTPIATAASIAASMALHMVEAFLVPLAEADDGSCAKGSVEQVSKEAANADAVVAGPGLMESQVNSVIASAMKCSRTGRRWRASPNRCGGWPGP